MALLGEQLIVETSLSRMRLSISRGGARQESADPFLARQLVFAIEAGDRDVSSAVRALLTTAGFESFELIDPARLAAALSEATRTGRVQLELDREQSLGPREESFPELPPLPPAPRRESSTTSFEVRWVDEIGKAIGGLTVLYDLGGEAKEVTTNAAGLAFLDDVSSSAARTSAPDAEQLARLLESRWTAPRSGKAPREANLTKVLFDGAPIGPVPVKPVLSHTVVVRPPLGTIAMQLFDKSGRVRHAGRRYTIEGPMSFSGVTDEQGRLRHERVFPGDYVLRLEIESFEGADRQVDAFESPVVVLARDEQAATLRQLGIVPYAVLVRLHAFFNTNKAFLLPTALPGVRLLRDVYFDNSPSSLLIVGHADTRGGAGLNDKLSLARAKSVAAFLKDDVDTWLEFYGESMASAQRWGRAEDRMMLVSMPDFALKPPGEDAIRWFQRTRKLSVDGTAGPQTRRQLVTEYMALDGANVEAAGLEIDVTVHGCGENFPVDDGGEELDEAPADEKRDRLDRRVELFFFDPEFGIRPAPPAQNSGPGSAQYPAWRKSVIETIDVRPDRSALLRAQFVELMDAHFRTNSAAILPEGEAPSGDATQHDALTSAGVFASALRFNAEHPGKRILIAGHTDTTASIEFNQKLSEERARVALALLLGGPEQRASFATLVSARHTVSDYKQILAWVSRELSDLGFACDPGTIDENAFTGVPAVKSFQRQYTLKKKELVGTDDLSAHPDLVDDGEVGPLTWGAVFDCYELALRRELGTSVVGTQNLRERLRFADNAQKSLGFSEHFPLEELGVDNFRSELNRRIEILFFDAGEEPDLAAAAADPETSELYLPGNYERVPTPPLLSLKGVGASWDALSVGFRGTRTMRFEAPGLPPGTPLTWVLSLEGGVPLATFQSLSGVDGGTQTVDDWVFPERMTGSVVLAPGDEFEPITFSFTVEGGGRSAESAEPLAYVDSLRLRVAIEVSFDELTFPDKLPYVIHTLAGSRRGRTRSVDGELGFVIEERLPPGGATLIVENLQAVFVESA